MEGKFVKGYKLTKQQRRDIKHAIKRGEIVDFKKILGIKDEQVGFGFKGISPIYDLGVSGKNSAKPAETQEPALKKE